MRNSIFTALLLALVMQLPASAQKYTPHEQWPFIYEDFARGEVIFLNGERIALESMNISVTDSKVYFYRNDSLLVSTRMAGAARIEGDDYIHVLGRMMKVLKRSEHGAVLLDTFVDREAMSRADVGYGFKSSVSSTETRQIFEGSNGATLSLRMNQPDAPAGAAVKGGGKELVTKDAKYIYINGGYAVRALKGEVADTPWLDRKALNAFWKQNKVRYSNDDSLAALAEYVWSEKK